MTPASTAADSQRSSSSVGADFPAAGACVSGQERMPSSVACWTTILR